MKPLLSAQALTPRSIFGIFARPANVYPSMSSPYNIVFALYTFPDDEMIALRMNAKKGFLSFVKITSDESLFYTLDFHYVGLL